jgi:hypothetical protein
MMFGVEKSTLMTASLPNILVIVGQEWSLNWIERITTCMQSYKYFNEGLERNSQPSKRGAEKVISLS